MTTTKTIDESTSPTPIEYLVRGACQMAARRSGEIRSLTIVVHRRPTYTELLRCRHVADQHGLTLVVVDSGVTLRPKRPKIQPAALPRRFVSGSTEPRGVDRVQRALHSLMRRAVHAFVGRNKWPKEAM